MSHGITNQQQPQRPYHEALRLLERLEAAATPSDADDSTGKQVSSNVTTAEVESDETDKKQSAANASSSHGTSKKPAAQSYHLPMDRDFESKYLSQYEYLYKKKNNETWKERVYMFLEHPAGWFGFIYHMSV